MNLKEGQKIICKKDLRIGAIRVIKNDHYIILKIEAHYSNPWDVATGCLSIADAEISAYVISISTTNTSPIVLTFFYNLSENLDGRYQIYQDYFYSNLELRNNKLKKIEKGR